MTPATLPGNFSEAAVATGLVNTTAMEIAPDGRIWALEQAGLVEVFHAGSAAGSTALTISPTAIDDRGERGLLGIAFDPSYNVANSAPDYVYLYYTSTSAPSTHNRISRFTVDNTNPDRPTLSDEKVLVDLDPLSTAMNHNGGAIHFGPDGKLYVAVGENANGANSQSITTRLGKILRYNADGTIPADNPTSFPGIAGTTSGAERAIWDVGVRNPFTFSFRPGTGQMNIDDVGQNLFEEIDIGAKGANYGWPLTEGFFDQASFPALTEPFYAYSHGDGLTQGIAITGGTFYDPPAGGLADFPASYDGDYFFADVGNGWINVIDPTTSAVSRFASDTSSPVDLHVGTDGSLYYLTRGLGEVVRVFPTASQAPLVTQQPTDQVASFGRSATFTVAVSGPTPISYQWQEAKAGSTAFVAIQGANGPSYTLANVGASDDGDQFRVVVANAFGTATSAVATLRATANQPPVATIAIDSGLIGGKFVAGRPVLFSSQAVDPEDGPLAASRLTFRVDYITSIASGNPVVRPFVPTFAGLAAAGFTPATTGPYTLADVAYRITLTATDSGGLTTTTVLDVAPNVAPVTVTTDPAGLGVTLDGQPYATPLTFEGVVGFQRPLGAPTSQSAASRTYTFVGWSDGGAAVHAISTPATATVYVADYTPHVPIRAQAPDDFDGDGRSDLTVYVAASGAFAYRPSLGGADVAVPFGIPGVGQTIPAVGDYDGDGKADIGAFLVSGAVYAYRPSTGGPDILMPFGIPGAGQTIPTPGDFDGQGRDEVAIYLPGPGAFVVRPSTPGPDQIIPFGFAGPGQSLPAVGDYFGTGQDDIAVYLPAIGSFVIRPPGGVADVVVPFGVAGLGQSIPAPGDYDGDGITDLAVDMPNLGLFAYRPSSGGSDVIEPFGAPGSGSVPVPGVYFGAGKTDLAIFDPRTATFAIRPAGGGADAIVPFGVPGSAASLPANASPSAVVARVAAVATPRGTPLARVATLGTATTDKTETGA